MLSQDSEKPAFLSERLHGDRLFLKDLAANAAREVIDRWVPLCQARVLSRCRLPSPLRIWSSFETGLVGQTAHVVNARLGLVHTGESIFIDNPPLVVACDRVYRNLPEIALAHQVIQRLRRLLLIVGNSSITVRVVNRLFLNQGEAP